MARQTLPSAEDAEREILSALFLFDGAVDSVAHLSPADFYFPRHAVVFKAMQAAAAHAEPMSMVTVAERLRIADDLGRAGGHEFLAELVDQRSSRAVLPNAARIVREKATARRIMETLAELLAAGYENPDARAYLDDVQARIFAITATASEQTRVSVRKLVRTAMEQYQARMDSSAEVTGIPSGLEQLDAITAGWQATDSVILAGRPGMGKTALAGYLSVVAARAGFPTLVHSLEMSGDQFVGRMICAEAGVNSQDWRRAVPRHATTVAHAAHRVANIGDMLQIDDAPALKAAEIRSRVRRWRAEVGTAKPGLVAVDYLQLVGGEKQRGSNREQEVAEASRTMKAIAKESRCTLLVLAQVNRECETRNKENKRPILSDLRESGSVEADADLVLFAFRECYYDPNNKPGEAEVIVAKQRNGPVGVAHVLYDDSTGRFANQTHRREPGDEG
jgi:replicative DNA helicase